MENELLSQLGIEWELFISQVINFGIVLVALTFLVYKPLMKAIKTRNKKIKEGLDKAEEADVRLKEIDVIGKSKIKEAENESISIIKATENRAKELEKNLQKKSEENQLKLQKELQENYKKQQEEAKNLVLQNALELVKKTIVKTVELKPADVDDNLIKKAAESLKDGN